MELKTSGVMFKPSFVKIGKLIQNVKEDTHRQHGDLTNIFLFLRKKYVPKNVISANSVSDWPTTWTNGVRCLARDFVIIPD